MSKSTYHQLEIWWVDLDPTVGAETQKRRPCVIVQSDLVNKGSRTVLVAPILPDHKTWPFVVNVVPSSQNGLDQNRHINLKPLRVVDTTRIKNQQGDLESTYLAAIHRALRLIFAI